MELADLGALAQRPNTDASGAPNYKKRLETDNWQPLSKMFVQAVVKGAAAEGRCTAGEEVAVALQLRDQFGNPAQAAPDAPLAVEATGAADIKFERANDGVFWCSSARSKLIYCLPDGGHQRRRRQV